MSLRTLQKQVQELQGNQEQKEPPDATKLSVVPPSIETNLNSSAVSENSVLSTAQDEYLMKLPEIKRKLTDELHKYVNTVVFKRNKFHMTSEAEEKYCRHAVATGKVKLPPGASSQAFARIYSKVLRNRVNSLRRYAQTNAKLKFEGESAVNACLLLTCVSHHCLLFASCCVADDWKNGRVPDNFLTNLMTGYRDYLDENGGVRKDRKGSFEAFVYFLDRMLPSVNTAVNKYNGPQRKTMGFSAVFSVNDEAFALVMMENYVERWKLLAENRKRCKGRNLVAQVGGTPGRDSDGNDADEDGGEGVNGRQHKFQAKYTSSNEGMSSSSGWSIEGIKRFNEFAHDIEKKRTVEQTGKGLEAYMMRFWQGTVGEPTSSIKEELGLVVAHCEDDSLFVGAMEFV